jgi:predicted double-glycine peptidase
LARLYSVAIASSARGIGLAQSLLHAGEEQASGLGRLFMRLEVAQNNTAAIQLYRKLGYKEFGTIEDYYEDHQTALRMQKRIRYLPQNLLRRDTPWYAQTTDFSCGPASLMMAMGSLDRSYQPNQVDELDIWRESTTIFMTSGHGGCHPVGLALAATRRNFRVEVYLNQRGPAFIEGVRNANKKQVLEVVDANYHEQAAKKGISVQFADITQNAIEEHLNAGGAAIILISHYRMHGVKTPHWVTITGMDDQCFYLHDPDCLDAPQMQIDCQHIPIARQDFEKMTAFGRQRLRTAVLLSL